MADESQMTPEEAALLQQQMLEQQMAEQQMMGDPTASGLPASATLMNPSDQARLTALAEQYGSKARQALEEQKSGLEQMRQRIQEYQDRPFQANLKPLMALADAWSKGKSRLAESYQAPETPEDRAGMMLKLENMLQQRREGMSKDELQLLKDQMAAIGKGTLSPVDMARINYFNAKAVSPLQLQQKSQDFQAHQRTLDTLRKDPNLKQTLQQYQMLSKAINTLFSSKITPQALRGLQQEARKAIMMAGGSGGVEERMGLYFDSLGLNSAAWKQFLLSKPEELEGGENNPFVRHMLDLIKSEQDTMRGLVKERMAAVTAGNPAVYERNPEFRRGLDEAMTAGTGQYKPNENLKAREITPTGTVKTWGGVKYKKVAEGPDNVKENWEKVE